MRKKDQFYELKPSTPGGVRYFMGVDWGGGKGSGRDRSCWTKVKLNPGNGVITVVAVGFYPDTAIA